VSLKGTVLSQRYQRPNTKQKRPNTKQKRPNTKQKRSRMSLTKDASVCMSGAVAELDALSGHTTAAVAFF